MTCALKLARLKIYIKIDSQNVVGLIVIFSGVISMITTNPYMCTLNIKNEY
jgi:hypothetical protein